MPKNQAQRCYHVSFIGEGACHVRAPAHYSHPGVMQRLFDPIKWRVADVYVVPPDPQRIYSIDLHIIEGFQELSD